MSNRFLRNYVIIGLFLLISGSCILYCLIPDINYPARAADPSIWEVPDINAIPINANAALVRYGRELIIHTSKYFGPKGTIAKISNGMNCQNCHLDAGTRLDGNCFALVASTYPKFKERSGRLESVEFRVNDCMQRSLNGKTIDSLSTEMRAMVAYIKWLGDKVPRGSKPNGMGIPILAFLNRPASPQNGQQVFVNRCKSCHGENGQGLLSNDSTGYVYPPLWGSNSYNVSAGIYMLSKLAGYVKYNMPYAPYKQEPQLSDEDAWDVAAFISTQKRAEKFFSSDWPNIASKPPDYPFGPFADSFSASQHKFGPFDAIKNAKQKAGK